MNVKMKLTALLLMGLLPAVSGAVSVPKGSAKDGRIQTVVYNPDDVIHVHARIGEAVLIQLEDGELLTGDPTSGLGMGDAKAWNLAAKGNNIYMKPVASSPATNMLITTNKKRTYAFDLSLTGKKNGKYVQKPTYVLRFIYPDTLAYKARAEAQKQAKALEKLKGTRYRSSVQHNYNYWGKGNKALAPTAAYDNGRFTYFSFDNGRELPLIYKVMADGTEMLLNSHVEGDTVVIHETAKHFVLRLGKSVLGLENRSFDEQGTFNRTGTGNHDFVRISREKEGR
jgi:tagB9